MVSILRNSSFEHCSPTIYTHHIWDSSRLERGESFIPSKIWMGPYQQTPKLLEHTQVSLGSVVIVGDFLALYILLSWVQNSFCFSNRLGIREIAQKKGWTGFLKGLTVPGPPPKEVKPAGSFVFQSDIHFQGQSLRWKAGGSFSNCQIQVTNCDKTTATNRVNPTNQLQMFRPTRSVRLEGIVTIFSKLVCIITVSNLLI